jgi:putative aldouronate transport system permease protein
MASAAMPNRRIRRSSADTAFDVTVFIVLLSVLMICVYPLYCILSASVSEPSMVSAGKVIFLPKGMNFDGYARIFNEPKI